jgi:16S rRNA (cytidine1402-2'-O)-methyltransferase
MKEGKLIVCATPIGNLEDASPRLARALAEADLVACEDTRQTRKLLTHLGVTTRMTSYHEVGERERALELADRVADGLRLALVSDAGMPAVSDPGYHLVAACLERGVAVEVVPGPSAALAALVVSGLPTDRFCFEGFLPRRPGQRDRRLAELASEPRTMVFFEAPHRVLATLEAMAAAFGPGREGAAVRELTKLHEQVLRGPLGEVRERLAAQGPRGELTLVVGGAPTGADRPAARPADLAAEVGRLVEGGTSTRDAVSAVAEATGAPRRSVYQAVLDARGESG